jgi:hypothetical protein
VKPALSPFCSMPGDPAQSISGHSPPFVICLSLCSNWPGALVPSDRAKASHPLTSCSHNRQLMAAVAAVATLIVLRLTHSSKYRYTSRAYCALDIAATEPSSIFPEYRARAKLDAHDGNLHAELRPLSLSPFRSSFEKSLQYKTGSQVEGHGRGTKRTLQGPPFTKHF